VRTSKVTVLTMAATYIGTVVGAGFASGQEVLQFFGLFGPLGIPAVTVAVLGFFVFGYACMEIGRQTKASSHQPVLRKVAGKTISRLLDFVTTFFLLGALSAMISGAGSVISQEFGLPWFAGASVMAVITFVTVLTGLKGITYVISSIVPFLLGGVFLISIAVICRSGLHIGLPPEGYEPPVKPWLLSGLNYVSYNILISVPVLSALGATANSRNEVFKASGLGALGLGLGLLSVYLTITSSFPYIVNYEVPLARLASDMWAFGGPFYVTIFMAEVYTTAVANLYGFSARFSRPGSIRFKATALITSVIALWAASAGFSTLVRIVYPVSGWAGTVFVCSLAVYLVRTLLSGQGK
jgi:uncharacterized membrane protein YkvI